MAQLNDIVASSNAASHPAAAAYAELLPEIVAVPDEELLAIKIDVIAAVTTVLGALPEIRALRPEIEALWRRFDFVQFDKLELYARALHHAHVLWRVASVSKADLAGLAGELDEVRDMLMKTTEALAAFKLIDGSRLKDVKKLPGYRPLASDVAAMVELIRERWDVVQGKCPLTLSDLDAFAAKALDLLSGVGIKDQAPVTTGEAALNRQRAFTLFHLGYDEARRAVLYLRPNDGDDIAPSLYAGRGGRPRAEGNPSEAPSSGTVTTAGGGSASPTLTINNPTGLPATSPFTS